MIKNVKKLSSSESKIYDLNTTTKNNINYFHFDCKAQKSMFFCILIQIPKTMIQINKQTHK